MAPRTSSTIVTGAEGSRSQQIHVRGHEVLDDPQLNRGTAFSPEERSHLGLHGMLPSGSETIDEQVARCYEQFRATDSDVEQVGLPDPAPRQQRGALLPAGRRARPRDAAHRLHAHGRCGDRAVQSPLPAGSGPVPHDRGRRRHRSGPGRHGVGAGRRRPSRGLRRRGDPRYRGLGCRGDRHLDREARGVHGCGRDRPASCAGGGSGRRHEPRRAPQRPPLSRPPSFTSAGRRVRRVHRRLCRPRVGALSPRDPALGGLLGSARRGGSSRASARPCAPSTTTSRARPPWVWRAPWPASRCRVVG